MSVPPGPIELPVEGLTDGDLRLRLRADADIPAIVAAARDPEIPRWTRVPDGYDTAKARAWAEQADHEAAEGTGLHLLIVGADDDRLIGSVGLVDVNLAESRCEIGYWVTSEHRGRGVAARAVRLLSAWAFENLPIERIAISADPDNVASRRTAEKAGYTFEGVLRSWFENKGHRHDAAVYSLLRDELR